MISPSNLVGYSPAALETLPLPPVVSDPLSDIVSAGSAVGNCRLVARPRPRLAIVSGVGETQPREVVSNRVRTSAM